MNPMGRLQAGDVLSYSSGSTQSGPWGFRRVGADRKLLESCVARWPVLLEALAGRGVERADLSLTNRIRFSF